MLKKIKKYLIVIIPIIVIASALLGVCIIKPSKSTLAKTELENLVDGIKTRYKNSPGFWGLDTNFVINNKITENARDGKIFNIFGKNTFVGYGFDATTLMPGSRTFDIVYKDLNRNECIALTSIELSEKLKLSLISVSIKNNDKIEEFSWGGDNMLPISINIAKRFCKESNDILWRFG